MIVIATVIAKDQDRDINNHQNDGNSVQEIDKDRET